MNLLQVEKITGRSLEQLHQLAEQISGSYRVFSISKGRGGKRWIKAPSDELKEVQSRLLHQFLYTVLPHDSVHGFVPNRSILSNAQRHVGQRMVANFDIFGFFPSTKERMVQNVLQRHYDLTEDLAQLLTSICCLDGELPQGAPTSPHIANLAMWDADIQLQKLAQVHGLVYTRYADDMTFSGEWTPEDIVQEVSRIIQPLGYRLASQKNRFYGRNKRQMVTGLVVNDKINLPRNFRKKLRAIIHDIEINGAEYALSRCDLSSEQILGYLSLQAMWDRGTALEQIHQLQELL